MADFPDESHNWSRGQKLKTTGNFTLSQQNLATGAWGGSDLQQKSRLCKRTTAYIIVPRLVISHNKGHPKMTSFGAENETRTRSYKQLYSNLLQSVSQNSCRKYKIFKQKTQAKAVKTKPSINHHRRLLSNRVNLL